MDDSNPQADAAPHDYASLRSHHRDSVFVMGTIGRPGQATVDAKVRDISAGGVMVDCTLVFAPGDPVEVTLRGVGVVPGKIAWREPAGRIGVVFDHTIDPALTRKPVKTAPSLVVVQAAKSVRRPALRAETPVVSRPPRAFR